MSKASISDDCIVHSRKYLSNFHANVNELHRTKEFSYPILQKLPKLCCSCENKKGLLSLILISNRIRIYLGEHIFTVAHLRKLCQRIQVFEGNLSTSKLHCDNSTIYYVILTHSEKLTVSQCLYKIGRFVGHNGESLQRFESSRNITINIVNKQSNKKLRELADRLQIKYHQYSTDSYMVCFTVTNGDHRPKNISKIKNALHSRWNDIVMRNYDGRTYGYNISSREIIEPSVEFTEDSRWRPKRRIPKSKLNKIK
ncbi:unnamed protein product [Adineta ricciae]|uniref:K Homology domain-containing protein n=1 Tax=Adineta ricciae TaxID=249248 RepID=A0A813YB02_ADIRI|nr:unnamed protein product [Adineta ricciae]CAF1358097.1 unnamed protein product [Adineta ricciae]